MLLKKTTRFLLGALFTVILASAANAATSSVSIDLSLSSIGADNPFGYDPSANNVVTVFITYDDAQGDNTVAGLSTHSLDNDTEFGIQMEFGIDGDNSVAKTYTELDDDFGWSPLATFNTDTWSINTIDFYVVDDDLNYWIKIETEEIGGDIVLTAGAVPVPSTVLLLGFGLFGLAGLHRRHALR
ncbi:MAG: PEP-CTERM sorting domain-containing protein [Desulfobacterales bacterium]|nr:PEP-CTERM sorting domain-containing protein [Desulfobacterales bacterium]